MGKRETVRMKKKAGVDEETGGGGKHQEEKSTKTSKDLKRRNLRRRVELVGRV